MMNHYEEAERLLASSNASDRMVAAAIGHAILAVAQVFVESE